ncbi:3-keto-5-aminohexanoate cleavage protein [Bacillus sp. 123MFChir2]|uniref:3-keto-5-aminohexanoate cleavage protein n=1 Tax=Bacillus sp. 123MFChir2 TaxID=1169144 RepID=UPI0003825624|nr:3-keto-5-aminohexanoate cleavage protein [Bacillus sp. 123MFChir2]
MKKTIICVAPTSFTTEGINNPLTPEEIADEVYKCYLQGASIAHLHVRDEKGRTTKNIENYLYTLELIKEKCDIIINIGNSDIDTIKEYINEWPQLKTVAIRTGSLTLFDSAVKVTRKDIENELNTALDLNLVPEFCVFDMGMFNNSKELLNNWPEKIPYYYSINLGYPGQMPATTKNIQYMSEYLEGYENWFYVECNRKGYITLGQALLLGAHIKIGYEDSVYDKENDLAINNSILVKRVADLSKALGREVASVKDTKLILGLK